MSSTAQSAQVPINASWREARPLWERLGADQRGPGFKATQRLCDVAALATAAAFAVPVGELIATSRRCAYVAFARQSAMYLAHVAFGLSYSQVARAFGRDRTTAAHACHLIEDRRDDPGIDAVLGLLEDACAALRRRLSAPVQP
jgi:DnaA-like protein